MTCGICSLKILSLICLIKIFFSNKTTFFCYKTKNQLLRHGLNFEQINLNGKKPLLVSRGVSEENQELRSGIDSKKKKGRKKSNSHG